MLGCRGRSGNDRRHVELSLSSCPTTRSGAAMATTPTELPELSIPTDKVCFIIAKAAEFDAKDVVTEPDPGSNATDDGMVSVLEDHKDDPVVAELAGLIHAMSEDEQIDLVALMWLGRGDGTPAEWNELRAEA